VANKAIYLEMKILQEESLQPGCSVSWRAESSLAGQNHSEERTGMFKVNTMEGAVGSV
jgi:hypothetical protein